MQKLFTPSKRTNVATQAQSAEEQRQQAAIGAQTRKNTRANSSGLQKSVPAADLKMAPLVKDAPDAHSRRASIRFDNAPFHPRPAQLKETIKTDAGSFSINYVAQHLTTLLKDYHRAKEVDGSKSAKSMQTQQSASDVAFNEIAEHGPQMVAAYLRREAARHISISNMARALRGLHKHERTFWPSSLLIGALFLEKSLPGQAQSILSEAGQRGPSSRNDLDSFTKMVFGKHGVDANAENMAIVITTLIEGARLIAGDIAYSKTLNGFVSQYDSVTEDYQAAKQALTGVLFSLIDAIEHQSMTPKGKPGLDVPLQGEARQASLEFYEDALLRNPAGLVEKMEQNVTISLAQDPTNEDNNQAFLRAKQRLQTLISG